MIKARLAKSNKLLLVFDNCKAREWLSVGHVTSHGMSKDFLSVFISEGISTDDISAVCLSDTTGKPKAAEFKEKETYVRELLEVSSFNLVVPVGATAFEKLSGMKGAAKYYKTPTISSVYEGVKILPIPSPDAVKYNPAIGETILETIRLIKDEMEFPEVREKEKLKTNYKVIEDIHTFRKWLDYYINNVEAFAYDTETKGFSFNSPTGALLCLSFSHKAGFSYLIPTDFYGIWAADEWSEIKIGLKRLLSDESKLLIGHNIKYDNKWIYHYLDVPVRRTNSFCSMIAAFLCNENTPNGLKDCAIQFTDLGNYELELDQWIDSYCKKNKVKKTAFTYDLIGKDVLFPYALTDSDCTFRLWKHFKEELVKEDQVKVFEMVNGKFNYLLTKIELNGWPIDVEYGEKLGKQLDEEIAKVETSLKDFPEIKSAEKILYQSELVKENAKRVNKIDILPSSKWSGFKFSSNNHKRVLFFDVMKLKVVKYTKAKDASGKRTTPSTDRESLEEWFYTTPKYGTLLETLQYYAELKKIKSTYVVGILSKTVNGRVHPTYSPIGAKPGRISAKDPNFMNLPARPRKPYYIEKLPLVKMVKKMVKAEDGRFLVGSDLSAIEMRWACIVSGDKKLEEIFNTGLDIHGAIAKELFDYIKCHPNEVKKLYEFERNSISKRVQFLSIYGGGPDTLAKGVNIENRNRKDENGNKLSDDMTTDQAQEILDNYFIRYSGVKQCIEDTTKFIEQNGYSLSVFGRKRRIPEVNAEDEGARARAIRQGVNAIFQSPASDSLLLALYELLIYIEDNNIDFKLCGPIHDAGYGETSEEYKLGARDLLLKYLQVPPFPVTIPITADCEGGQSWADFSEDFGNELSKEESEDSEDEEEAA